MKTKLLSLFLLLAAGASAQIISIPDANFKSKLLSAAQNVNIAYNANGNRIKIDTNSNGEIEQSEVLLVYRLDVEKYNNQPGNAIQSLEGIQYFTNLTYLNARNNDLTSVNISGLSNLEGLSLDGNQLLAFDGTGLINLNNLWLNSNELTVLDVSMCSALTNLNCSDNQISSINISDLDLEILDYSSNPLPTLNVSVITSLTSLSCNNIGSSSLDLTGLIDLEQLKCSGNLFTTIDASDLISLTYLECKNSQLTELDLSHSPNLAYIHVTDNPLLTSINLHNEGITMYPLECQFTNNPSLQLICVDEGEADVLLEYFEENQVTAPYMSTDCTFVPGEVYNSISGVVKYDFNANGCDAGDNPAMYTKVKIVNGTDEKIRFTNNDGEYFKYVGIGNYDITVESENSLFSFTPSPASVNFPLLDGTAHVQDFCLISNGISPDVEIAIAPSMVAMPGFNTSYSLILKNNGNQVLSGAVTFNFDDTVLDFVSAIPQEASLTGGVITWNYTDLLPFENRLIYVTLDLNAPTDTPAVNIDDQLDFTVQATPTSGDLTPDNNSFELNQIVVGSFDPNNIICLQGETEDPEAIGDYLGYVINFENIGTAAATFVVVTQQIDETMFDVKSLELLNSSHDVEATIDGNMVEFRFDAINLGGGEQGNITFKIKTLQTLVEGDEVMNSAKIVFDHNFPIQTNTATTLFEATVLDKEKFEVNNLVNVYPNPVKDNVTINADGNLQSIQLYDIQGRLLQTTLENNTTTTFDMAKRAAGIYLLKVTTEKGVKTEKIIKE